MTANQEPPAKPTGIAKVIGADFYVRTLSAIVLGVVVVGLTAMGRSGFGLLVLLVSGVLAWEWGGIVRGSRFDRVFAAHLAIVAAGVGIAFFGHPGWASLVLVVGAGVVAAVAVVAAPAAIVMSGLGVLYAGLPAVALLWLHSDALWGMAAILFILLVVWSTDTCAYIAGRSIGGAKLWPSVSPNKTWSGFLGGVLSAAVLSAALGFSIQGASWVHLFVIGLFLAIVSQAGDLAESAMKRHYGVKDASNLIPGHGGFMDRVDGLVAAAVAAALVALMVGGQWPAKALLGLS